MSKELRESLKGILEQEVDIKNRIVYMVGDIENLVVDSTVKQLLFLASPHYFPDDHAKPIHLILNSVGGEDDAMFYLYDVITNLPTEVYIIGTGIVCSAAVMVLVAGDKRFATPNCFLMSHKGKSTLFDIDDDEIHSVAELSGKLADRYWKILERHTSKTALQWYRKSRNEGQLWLDAEQMLKWGVIDAILEPTRRSLGPLSSRRVREVLKDLEDENDE